jgi:hypothetical protein
MTDVLIEQPDSHGAQRRRSGIDLSEDVDAVRVIGDHSLQPSHLALDPGETIEVFGLVQRVTAHATSMIP